jgi:hypothetical protein
MAPEAELLPETLPEILGGLDQTFDSHGWYAESAEGVLVPYLPDPEELDEVMKAVEEAAKKQPA